MNIKNYRQFFIPVSVIFLALLSFIVIVPGQIKNILSKKSKIERVKSQTEELKTKYLLISSLDKGVLAEQAKLALMALPENKNVPYILQGLRNAVAKGGFLVKSLKFAPGEIVKSELVDTKLSKKRIEILPIEVKLIGSIDQLSSLFKAIEEVLPLFNIEDVSVNLVSSAALTSRVNLKLTTFYSPPAKAYKKGVIKLADLVLSENENKLLEKLSKFEKTILEQSFDLQGESEEGLKKRETREFGPFNPDFLLPR